MKRALLLLFFWPSISWAQTANVVNSAGCFSAVGYTAADSLGEGPRTCLTGTNACNVPMLQTTGTAEFSIINTPGIPFPNTACTKSLQMSKAGASSYLTARGMIPTTNLASGGIYDLTFYVYVSAAPPSGSTLQILSMQATGTSTTNARVQINNNAGQLRVQATDNSVSSSAFVNISATTWYRIDLHGQTGANLCWIAVSTTDLTGTHKTFTCNTTNTAVTTAILGGGDTSASGTVVYGNWKIRTNSTGSAIEYPSEGPAMYLDFENSTPGTTVTTTILGAGIRSGGIGSWSGTSTAMTVATACEKQLTVPVRPNFAGTSYNDSGSTRGIKFDLSTSTASQFSYALNSTSRVISEGFWIYTDHYNSNDSSDGFYSFHAIATNSGTADFVSTMIHGGLMYLETAANPNGTPDTCTNCTTNGLHTGSRMRRVPGTGSPRNIPRTVNTRGRCTTRAGISSGRWRKRARPQPRARGRSSSDAGETPGAMQRQRTSFVRTMSSSIT